MIDPSLTPSQEATATTHPEDYARAMLNILEDFSEEKVRLEES